MTKSSADVLAAAAAAADTLGNGVSEGESEMLRGRVRSNYSLEARPRGSIIFFVIKHFDSLSPARHSLGLDSRMLCAYLSAIECCKTPAHDPRGCGGGDSRLALCAHEKAWPMLAKRKSWNCNQRQSNIRRYLRFRSQLARR